MTILIPVFITALLVWNLYGQRKRLALQIMEGEVSFGRAADKLAVHFLLTICLLQTAWFLWFVIAYFV